MARYFEMLGSISTSGWLFIVALIVILGMIGFAVYRIRTRAKRGKAGVIEPQTSVVEGESEPTVPEDEVETGIQVGTGPIVAYCFRDGNLEVAKTDNIYGHPVMSEPSMPKSGLACLLIAEGDEVKTYDPLIGKIDATTTPIAAADALDWEDALRAVYGVSEAWWSSVPTWMAIGSFVILLLTVFIVLG